MTAGRFELPTYGLGNHRNFNNFKMLDKDMDQPKIHEQVHGKVHVPSSILVVAQSILDLSSAGHQVPTELTRILADAVLTNATVQLAQRVRVGGSYTLMNAIRLAEILLHQGKPQESHVSEKGGTHYAALLAS